MYHPHVLMLPMALALGFLHGLGADHLMAIAALSVGPERHAGSRRLRALGIALRFAVGHALLLCLGAAASILLGWHIPVVVEQAGEMAGGSALVALGAAGLGALVTGRLYAHSHPHGMPSHVRWHMHIGRPDRHPLPADHSHLPMLLGAVFAVSGLRALSMLVPFGEHAASLVASTMTLLALVAVFALGILLSMALFGVLLAQMMSTRLMAGVGRAVAAVTAAASLAMGLYWIVA